MARGPDRFRTNSAWMLGVALFLGCTNDPVATPPIRPADKNGIYHVYPGESIQATLEVAAADAAHKTVLVHEGVYRPSYPGQALIWFNARHDGIHLQAEGKVVLTAQNPNIAERDAPSFPAVVNHIVYFGDGISNKTLLRGFRITGANNFVTYDETKPIETHTLPMGIERSQFFYADGGGIKIFGRSYPTLEDLEVFDNYTDPCGAGISVEHRGFKEQPLVLRNCVFRNNRCRITGSAVDLLPGSSAIIENCLFVKNVSNLGDDYISEPNDKYNEDHGSGALTVFPNSKAHVERCTFTDNWNGVDDKGDGNVYRNCIFWRNVRQGGISPRGRYELDIVDGSQVTGCLLQGDTVDLRESLDATKNVLDAPDPEFDLELTPGSDAYVDAGYRPKG